MTHSGRLSRLVPVAMIATAALLAVLPLMLHGCSCGHDFDFHLVNWLEAHQQFRQGTLHPQWAFTAAWGAGEPRFVFYPPLSWVIGGLLGFLVPYTVAPIVYTWLCLFLAGLTAFRMAHTLGAPRPQGTWVCVAVALVYLANPYILFTAYERTAYAELLAAAWMPLLLTAILRERPRWLEVALPITLLWLTNAPAAVLGCYGLLLIGVLRLLLWPREQRRSTLLHFIVGTVLGLLAAAFYILPALVQRGWVQAGMAVIEGMRPQDNFLFGHTSDPVHDTVLWQASRIAVLLLALSFSMAAALYKNRTARVLGAASLVILFLLLPVSGFVWHHAPQLAFLQFPWRFLALQQAIAAGLLTMLLARISALRWPASIASLALLSVTVSLANHFYRQGCDDEDYPTAHIALFAQGGGVLPTDEYTVTGADNDLLPQGNPSWWLGNQPDAPAPQVAMPNDLRVHVIGHPKRPDDATWNTEHTVIHALWARSQWLIVNRRAYPAWEVTLNGTPTPITERADGLMAVPVPAGPTTVEIRYHRTWDQYLGAALTLMALVAAAIGWRIRAHQPTSHPAG